MVVGILVENYVQTCLNSKCEMVIDVIYGYTGKLGYDGPLYDRLLSMTDDWLCPSPMHIKYVSSVYDRFCI